MKTWGCMNTMYTTKEKEMNTLYREKVESEYPDLTIDTAGQVIFANNVLHTRRDPSDDPGWYRDSGYYYTDDNGNRKFVAVKYGNGAYNRKRRADIPDDDVLYEEDGWK